MLNPLNEGPDSPKHWYNQKIVVLIFLFWGYLANISFYIFQFLPTQAIHVAYDSLFMSKQVCLYIWLCSMCLCSDGPRAALINEFTLPMWHCCDNQIPRQACSFPLRASLCVCGGRAQSLFYDKDTTFPALSACFVRARPSERVMTRQQQKHDQWNSSSRLNPLSRV